MQAVLLPREFHNFLCYPWAVQARRPWLCRCSPQGADPGEHPRAVSLSTYPRCDLTQPLCLTRASAPGPVMGYHRTSVGIAVMIT